MIRLLFVPEWLFSIFIYINSEFEMKRVSGVGHSAFPVDVCF